MDNQEEIQHGCPGVLGFIFYNGQPMNPHGELSVALLSELLPELLSKIRGILFSRNRVFHFVYAFCLRAEQLHIFTTTST